MCPGHQRSPNLQLCNTTLKPIPENEKGAPKSAQFGDLKLNLIRESNQSLSVKIKDRWPLPAMLARCGITVPPKGKFHSPFRPDATPSCEIYRDAIKDRSTGQSYDSIAVFAETNRISNSEAFRKLAAELPDSRPRPIEKPRALEIPPTKWCLKSAHDLAKLRGLSPFATELAGAFLGSLRFGKALGHDCWLLTDGGGHVAEARRMNGEKFPAVGTLGERKSHTLRGSRKSWPVGMTPPKIKRLSRHVPVVLVEGGPDYLAACDLLSVVEKDFLPVTMLGASLPIHADALPFFHGRKVTILAHPDESGIDASRKWFSQILEAGGKPKAVQLKGGDLCELVAMHGAAYIAQEVLS